MSESVPWCSTFLLRIPRVVRPWKRVTYDPNNRDSAGSSVRLDRISHHCFAHASIARTS